MRLMHGLTVEQNSSNSGARCNAIGAAYDPRKQVYLCSFYKRWSYLEFDVLRVQRHRPAIHQFDISGLSFATGSGRELGVKELCQLYVYNSIVRVKQSSVFEIRQKFLRFVKVLLSLRDLISRNSFFKSSCIRFARSDYRLLASAGILFLSSTLWTSDNFKRESSRIKKFSASPRTEFVWS